VLGLASIAGMGWSIVAWHARRDAGGVSADRRIEINSASAAELELLPEIGPALAKRIHADRVAHGRFLDLDDLARVEGVGPRTISRIRPFVVIDGADVGDD